MEYREDKKCRICNSGMFYSWDGNEGTTYETKEDCKNCRLYHYDFSYGNTSERIGLVFHKWSYGNINGSHKDWRELKELEDEAKVIYSSTTAMAIVKGIFDEHSWLDNSVALLVFADWCQENDLILHDRYLRRYVSGVT